MSKATRNKDRLEFLSMPRAAQDQIAGAIARGEPVEIWGFDRGQGFHVWHSLSRGVKAAHQSGVYRLPRAAKDPLRPRPAHKLDLRSGDVVRQVKTGLGVTCAGILYLVGKSPEVGVLISNPPPKGQRPLFIVVSRAKESE